jgi:hypothetical protein
VAAVDYGGITNSGRFGDVLDHGAFWAVDLGGAAVAIAK